MVKENFSRRAGLYDEYADIQRLAANDLISYAPEGKISNILEIGCGTGNYTLLLSKKFPSARIKAIDNSEKMIEVARSKFDDARIEFLVADGEKTNPDGKFDFITSNAVFHWFGNLDAAVGKYRNALTEGGVISFSIFGPKTFWELSLSLKKALGRDVEIDAARFPEEGRIDVILNKYFGKYTIEEHLVKERFSSLIGLLDKIRGTGVRGNAIDNLFLWKKNIFNKAEDIYRADYGRIEASYQIFFCKASACQ